VPPSHLWRVPWRPPVSAPAPQSHARELRPSLPRPTCALLWPRRACVPAPRRAARVLPPPRAERLRVCCSCSRRRTCGLLRIDYEIGIEGERCPLWPDLRAPPVRRDRIRGTCAIGIAAHRRSQKCTDPDRAGRRLASPRPECGGHWPSGGMTAAVASGSPRTSASRVDPLGPQALDRTPARHRPTAPGGSSAPGRIEGCRRCSSRS